MKYPDNIKDISYLKPDYMGFIFYPPSKRFIGVDFETQFLKTVTTDIIKTGVFVNATFDEVIEFGKLYGMQAIQLHGDESPGFCKKVKSAGFILIKAFGVNDTFDFKQLETYENHVDFYLFDTKTSSYGGSGQTFSWQILDKYVLGKPFLLSGGINLENLSEVIKVKHSQLYGIDINSGFETEPGLKDIEKVKRAFEFLKN